MFVFYIMTLKVKLVLTLLVFDDETQLMMVNTYTDDDVDNAVGLAFINIFT